MSVRGATRPRPWLLGALLVGAVLTLPPSGARAAARSKPPRGADVAAARRLIAIQTRYFQRGIATRRESRADVNASIAQMQAACPHSIPNSLAQGTPSQRSIWDQLFTEASDDVGLAADQPLGDATATYAKQLGRLHFSHRALNVDVRELSRATRLSVALVPSDPCMDVKAAAASGFTVVPAATRQFIDRVNKVIDAPAPGLGDLARDIRLDLVNRTDRTAYKRLEHVAEKYSDFLFTLGVNAGFKLAGILGAGPSRNLDFVRTLVGARRFGAFPR